MSTTKTHRRLDPSTLAHAVDALIPDIARIMAWRRRAVVQARLTPRELEILRLVAAGRPDQEVAKILWVTNQTIKFRLANICQKLNVRNRIEAVLWLREHGLL